jgi:hypothetical protein
VDGLLAGEIFCVLYGDEYVDLANRSEIFRAAAEDDR